MGAPVDTADFKDDVLRFPPPVGTNLAGIDSNSGGGGRVGWAASGCRPLKFLFLRTPGDAILSSEVELSSREG